MSTSNLEEKRKKRYNGYYITYALLIIAMTICLWPRYATPPDNTAILEGDGYKATITANIVPMNRYTPTTIPDSGRPIGLLVGPQPAQIEEVYLEDFEGATDWVAASPSGIVSKPAKFVYQGSYSYRFQRNDIMSNPTTFSLDANNTLDISFYLIAEKNITGDGFLTFGFNATASGYEQEFEFIISEHGTGYNLENTILMNLTGFVVDYWTGYLITNLRQIIMNNNDSLEYEAITIHNLHYDFYESDPTGLLKVYIDSISVIRYAFGASSGNWYNEAHVLSTDYQLSINFYIQADEETVNISTLTLYLRFSESLNSSISTIFARNFENIILGDFDWDANIDGIYDWDVTGNYLSPLHPLPNGDSLGSHITWSFNSTYICQATDLNGNQLQVTSENPISGFTMDYESGIQL